MDSVCVCPASMLICVGRMNAHSMDGWTAGSAIASDAVMRSLIGGTSSSGRMWTCSPSKQSLAIDREQVSWARRICVSGCEVDDVARAAAPSPRHLRRLAMLTCGFASSTIRRGHARAIGSRRKTGRSTNVISESSERLPSSTATPLRCRNRPATWKRNDPNSTMSSARRRRRSPLERDPERPLGGSPGLQSARPRP